MFPVPFSSPDPAAQVDPRLAWMGGSPWAFPPSGMQQYGRPWPGALPGMQFQPGAPGIPQHVHLLRGQTSTDAGHSHFFAVTTGTVQLADGTHIHPFQGVTTADAGHTHGFRGMTQAAAPAGGGHVHAFGVVSSPASIPVMHSHAVQGFSDVGPGVR